MLYNDPFEQRIRQRFSGARMEPSPDLWARLEPQLPNAAGKRRPLWLWGGLALAVAAAIVLLLAFAGSEIQSPGPEAPARIAAGHEAQHDGAQAPFVPEAEPPLSVQSSMPSPPEESGDSHTNAVSVASAHDVPVSPETLLEAPYSRNTEGAGYSKRTFAALSKLAHLDIPKLHPGAAVPRSVEVTEEAFVWPVDPGEALATSHKPGKKGTFAFFAGGGVSQTGLAREEVEFMPNPNYGTNQGAGFEARDLPLQRNLYPQIMISKYVGAELFVSDRVSLEAGLGLSRYRHAVWGTSADEDFLGVPNYADPTNFNQVDLSRAIAANRLEHTVLDIPLGVNYYLGNANRSLAVSGAVSIQPVISNASQSLKRAEYDLRASVASESLQESVTNNELLNPYAVTTRLGLTLQQQLGRNLYVYGGPNVAYALAPAYASLSGLDQSRLGMGLEMGVRWQSGR